MMISMEPAPDVGRDGEVSPGAGCFLIPGLGRTEIIRDGDCCPDCGSYRWTVTNRRIACLPCYVATRGSSLDPHTRLYPGEIVCGVMDTIDRVIILDRPIKQYLLPALGLAEDPDEGDDAEAMDRSDDKMDLYINRSDKSKFVNVAIFNRGDFERSVYPENRGGPNVGGPTGDLKPPPVDSLRWDARLGRFVARSEMTAVDAKIERTRRPRKAKKFADDPNLLGEANEDVKGRTSRRLSPDE
jgi:hypothetical protein